MTWATPLPPLPASQPLGPPGIVEKQRYRCSLAVPPPQYSISNARCPSSLFRWRSSSIIINCYEIKCKQRLLPALTSPKPQDKTPNASNLSQARYASTHATRNDTSAKSLNVRSLTPASSLKLEYKKGLICKYETAGQVLATMRMLISGHLK